MNNNINIRHPKQDEYDHWSKLYLGYAEFYKVNVTEEMTRRLWSWIHDDKLNVFCNLALVDNQYVGLTHYRQYIHPLAAERAYFMDDLFVATDRRKLGVGRALIESVAKIAEADDCHLVRWITGDDNLPAQGLYDQIAKRTPWVTYDMQI